MGRRYPEGAAEEEYVTHANAALVEVMQVVPLRADLVLLRVVVQAGSGERMCGERGGDNDTIRLSACWTLSWL
jgi:hypothetical protein